MAQVSFAVLTISDSCHTSPEKDRSGPRLVQCIREAFNNAHITTAILPDEQFSIESKLRELIAANVATVITTGGTGFAPRDITPEATRPVLDKECPQLSTAIALSSLQKTKFAVLSRGICGIAQRTLILNFPGSEKAVVECFDVVRDILPHALHLICNDLDLVRRTHAELQSGDGHGPSLQVHVCPHKTGKGGNDDRNSMFAMIPMTQALDLVFKNICPQTDITRQLADITSPIDIPQFRASIKDGYAMKSTGFSGAKRVIGYIAAGDPINLFPLQEDECFKINTGAPMPENADCVAQIEDTKLVKTRGDGLEDIVDILIEPKANLDVRPIGCDLKMGTLLFPFVDHSPVVTKSILASVGKTLATKKNPKIAIISTGSELLAPDEEQSDGKIYDSNTTMLEELLTYFGFECTKKLVLSDDFDTVQKNIEQLYNTVDFVICSGGVSMGDKDYIKPALEKLTFKINFGRVNMKPGKPMTFASRKNQHFFGLPGNPVSAFVCFHLFVLPAIRWSAGWTREKCELATLTVTLENGMFQLDPRPEYVRASITSRNGQLFAIINGSQMSSRLQSIVGADVLVHLPGSSPNKTHALAGDVYSASVLRYDFISKYD